MNRSSKVLILSAPFLILVIWIVFLRESAESPKPIESKSERKLKKQFGLSDFVWSNKFKDWALDDLGRDASHMPTEQPYIESCVWPEQQSAEHCHMGDRIIDQLKLTHFEENKSFKIANALELSSPIGQDFFVSNKCPINNCEITYELGEADVIIFPNSDVRSEPPGDRRGEQIWIAHLLESPPNTFDKRFNRPYRGRHKFNWTASYRSDSDIVTPYAKFVPYLSSETPWSSDIDAFFAQASERIKTLIRNKQNRVAWFVSNCHAKNQRLEYARQLAQYIPVDIYGRCGNLTCQKWDKSRCLSEINRDYKFYLAFENSNNREYITEKLFENSLGYNDQDHLLIPIVMGPPPGDYFKRAPPNSFIHVENYDGPEDLARYLKHLGTNDALYHSYFRWKTEGEFVDTKFLCRVCAMAHKSYRDQTYRSVPDIKKWWLEVS